MLPTKKVVIVGDGACGKTCLSVVFSKNEFPEDHIPTIYDTYMKVIQVEGNSVELSLWDTAGEEDYDRLRPLSYSGANVIIICFSIDNPDSLTNVVKKWAPELRHFCSHVPVILVGNKLDLRNNNSVIEFLNRNDSHPVTYDQGMKVARKIKAFGYLESSAKTLVGVRDVFTKAAQIALASEHEKKSRHKRCCICN